MKKPNTALLAVFTFLCFLLSLFTLNLAVAAYYGKYTFLACLFGACSYLNLRTFMLGMSTLKAIQAEKSEDEQ